MRPEFDITEESLDGDRHVVAVRGELDLYTAPEFKAKIDDAVQNDKTRIVVDLTATSYADETALSTLISAHKRLRNQGGAFVLINTDPNLVQMFVMTGLDQVFTMRRTRDEAIAALDDGEHAEHG